MRIAMLNWTARRVAGAEACLARTMPALAAQGHEVVLAAESESGSGPWITGKRLVAEPAAVRAWHPDVIVNHGLRDPRLETDLIGLAPAVLVGHSYYGTCISGSKTFTWPTLRPCARTLDGGCLLRYYPRRTGGLDPRTMLSDWQRQRRRKALFERYRATVVFSPHMAEEFAHNGVPATRVHVLPFPMDPPPAARPPARDASTLLFVGRCEPLKGGQVLIDAMGSLDESITLTMVGDGPARPDWERRARHLGNRVRFAGWVDDVTPFYAATSLVVIPSLWPEPFGQVGLEAGRFGVPAVAFPVGGMAAWLSHGVNGLFAARANDADALARAIEEALAPERHPGLARGAVEALGHHSVSAHAAALVRVLEAL